MKGKIFLFLFALPFFGVGVWMGWSIGDNLVSANQMRSWVAVDAVVERGGYDTHRGDDSDTYEAYADYRYHYAGNDYSGNRVGLSSGADNVGGFQARVGSELAAAARAGHSITVYVDPANPSDSIIKRELRWEMLGFKAIFVLLFGGAGLGLMIYSILSSAKSASPTPQTMDKPWLQNADWQSPSIRSSSRTSMFVAWGIATVWNLISAPIPFVLYEEVVEKANYLGLVALLFPLVGIGLLVWAVKCTREWRRFGPTPVTLDPFPGSIGGHVGGHIDLSVAFSAEAEYSVTLSCIHSYVSGSGKDKSRRESVKWQDSQAAHIDSSAIGSRLRFRFDVPEGLQPSDAGHDSESYILWRLNVQGDIPGVDLDRSFEIPVYATGTSSKNLPEHSLQRARAKQHRQDDERFRASLGLTSALLGNAIHFPAFRNPSPGMLGALVGGFFASVGSYLLVSGESYFIGGGFCLVGGPICLFGVYSLIKSLEVRLAGAELETIRRVCGIKVRTRKMQRQEIARLLKDSSVQTQSGGKHVKHYSIYAENRRGDKMVIGEGFRGENEADAGIRVLSEQLGIALPEKRNKAKGPADDNNFLAAGQ